MVSRVRRDAALWSLSPVVAPGQRGRGRPRIYGTRRIDLAQRAAQERGWQTGTFSLSGRLVVKRYKTFLPISKPVGGVIRVVLVREVDRWMTFFATAPEPSVAAILEAVVDRSALEQVFHRSQGGSWCRSTVVAPRLGERGCLEPDRFEAHAGGALVLGPAARPVV